MAPHHRFVERLAAMMAVSFFVLISTWENTLSSIHGDSKMFFSLSFSESRGFRQLIIIGFSALSEWQHCSEQLGRRPDCRRACVMR